MLASICLDVAIPPVVLDYQIEDQFPSLVDISQLSGVQLAPCFVHRVAQGSDFLSLENMNLFNHALKSHPNSKVNHISRCR